MTLVVRASTSTRCTVVINLTEIRGMEAIYQSILDRFSTEIDRGQVVPIRMRSIDAATKLTIALWIGYTLIVTIGTNL